jgi:hypothetical protein
LEHVTSTWEDGGEGRNKGSSKGRKEGENTDTDTDRKQETGDRRKREAPQCLRGRQYILIEATGREGSCFLPVLLIFQNILSSKQARGGKRRKEGEGKGKEKERGGRREGGERPSVSPHF